MPSFRFLKRGTKRGPKALKMLGRAGKMAVKARAGRLPRGHAARTPLDPRSAVSDQASAETLDAAFRARVRRLRACGREARKRARRRASASLLLTGNVS